MVTFYLQCAATVCLVFLGWSALAVSRSIPHALEKHRAAWRLVGIAFILHSSDLLIQNVFAGLALLRGTSSRLMAVFVDLMPLFNHSRTFLLLGLCAALCLLGLWNKPVTGGFWRAAYALLAVGLVSGAVVGRVEGPFVVMVHFTAVAVWDVVELLLLLTALFILLLKSAADRHLWSMLALYAFSLALGVFWSAAFSQADIPNTWSPPPWTIAAVRTAIYLLMLGFVLRRWALARRGTEVPAMFDSPRVQPSFLH
ncbi:MAG TPA: hypothetical protein VEW03_02145 [Longimicrobiaceae bacterium]|nr:hypothetical protein [Longimicrobiaceae bacterium]